MKAGIDHQGFIVVVAETPTEAYALKYLYEKKEVCGSCGHVNTDILIDCSVLNGD